MTRVESRNLATDFRILFCLALVALIMIYTENTIQSIPSLSNDGDNHKQRPLHHHQSWIPQSQTSACSSNHPEILPEWYMSQSGEDQELMQYFGNLCGGTYLELGALDGKRFSNTFVFKKGLNWTGVLIEASPISYKKLQYNRPDELATVHAGVCETAMDLHWSESPWNTPNKRKQAGPGAAMNGFFEFAAPEFQQKYWSERNETTVQVVRCLPLRDILMDTVGPTFYFDFFSLDVEGAEYAVLQSIDFDQVAFGFVFVEADTTNPLKNMAIRQFLQSKGYNFLFSYERSWWFANEQFGQIYKDMVYLKRAFNNATIRTMRTRTTTIQQQRQEESEQKQGHDQTDTNKTRIKQQQEESEQE